MATLPNSISAVPLDANLTTASQPGLTWYIDRHSMRITGACDNYTAVRQAVEIILNTDRYRWQIYRPTSGTDYRYLIGANIGYVSSELKRRIIDALLMDDRVKGISNYAFAFSGDEMTASFTVNTIFGKFQQNVVVPL